MGLKSHYHPFILILSPSFAVTRWFGELHHNYSNEWKTFPSDNSPLLIDSSGRIWYCTQNGMVMNKNGRLQESVRQKAIKMYIDWVGLRRTGHQLGVHPQRGANWAKKHAEGLPEVQVDGGLFATDLSYWDKIGFAQKLIIQKTVEGLVFLRP